MGDIDQAKFEGSTPYQIMFGPDICGYSTKRIHAIFNHNGDNLLIKKTVDCETDEYTHVYTLEVESDNTYKILVDGAERDSGSLYDQWDFEKPKEINDPDQSKPSDWVDTEMMSDPLDSKPDDWEQEETIADPDAEQPEDWDEEDDGEWEPPMIPNPDFKGEWKAKQIKNPDYKGPWEHPQVPNPEYEEQSDVYKRGDLNHVGFEIWQVKAGTVFGNLMVTDDKDAAKAARDSVLASVGSEKDAHKAFKDAEEAEKAAAEAEEADADADEDEDDDDEIDEDDADLDALDKDEL